MQLFERDAAAAAESSHSVVGLLPWPVPVK